MQKACLVKSHVKSRGIASSCYSIGDIEKTSYVEAHELGLIYTVLQILKTLDLGICIII